MRCIAKKFLRNAPEVRQRQGFTLIELLVVISVVGILVGITFGVSRGVQTAQSRALAKAELSIMSQALEQFKSRYGDYPWHDSNDGEYPTPDEGDMTNTMLLYALTGRLKMERIPDGAGGTKINVFKVDDRLDADEVKANAPLLDATQFLTTGTLNEPNQLLDPWGNPYRYWYKWENSPNGWEVFGYHLYSTGPNGAEANDAIKDQIDGTSGVFKSGFRDAANAAGIIFAGE